MTEDRSNQKTSPNGTSEGKKKFPIKLATILANKIVAYLEPHVERIIVAGSIRRNKPMVGDIEILYIPKFKKVPDPNDLFGESKSITVDCVDEALRAKIDEGMFEQRGGWGEKNKLARHVPTGMPVDFFATDQLCWFNYLVCRTGPGESNMNIANIAKQRGWRWQPYGRGFVKLGPTGEPDERAGFHPVNREEDVFLFVGMPVLPPEDRH